MSSRHRQGLACLLALGMGLVVGACRAPYGCPPSQDLKAGAYVVYGDDYTLEGRLVLERRPNKVARVRWMDDDGLWTVFAGDLSDPPDEIWPSSD